MHGVAAGGVSSILLTFPRIYTPIETTRYTVRLLDVHTPKPLDKDARENASLNSPFSAAHTIPGPQSGLIHPPSAIPGMRRAPDPHMLIQLDTPAKVELPQEVSIPLELLVSPVDVQKQKIVPPASRDRMVADVVPVPELPNRETTLANVSMMSTDLKAVSLPVQPSTTSPIVTHGPESSHAIPQTPSLSQEPPAPATVMAISDVQLKDGTVVLPRATQLPSATAKEGAGSGAAQGAHDQKKLTADAGNEGYVGPGQGPSVKRLVLPKNGQFSMVLVGNSLEEQYPETAGTWSGRLAYTVYLHVGLAKSWILQYSLPRDQQAAAGGKSGHIEAPWPTDILVPNFPAGYTGADALIVHGMLNKDGRFDQLAVAFPPQFPETSFVLDLLKHWIFRAATQNGQIAAVEVLLIIPEQDQ